MATIKRALPSMVIVLLTALGASVFAAEAVVATLKFTPVGGQYLEAPATLAADGYRVFRVTDKGVLYVSEGLGFGNAGVDAVSSFSTVSSNGTTPVTLVAASAGKAVHPTSVLIVNAGATDETVTIMTSGGQAIYPPFPLAAGEKFIWEPRGDVRTTVSEALQLKLGDAGTDVKAGGFFVYR